MIVGHHKIRQRLQSLVQTQRFPQTSLFYGLAGSGKKQVAYEIAESLLVHDENTKALFQSGQHPDFFLIAPQASKSQSAKKNVSEGSIRIEQIQELKKSLGFSPLLSDKQVIVIDSAELMTKATANSLLKILEEPKAHQIFILITKSLHDLLITVRSRATKFYFAPLSQKEVLEVIKANSSDSNVLNEAQLDFFYKIFPGSPSLIMQALQMGISSDDFKTMAQKAMSLIDVRRRVAQITASEVDVDLFLQTLRGVVLCSVLENQDASQLAFLDKIQNAERQMARHISNEFVLENLFL